MLFVGSIVGYFQGMAASVLSAMVEVLRDWTTPHIALAQLNLLDTV